MLTIRLNYININGWDNKKYMCCSSIFFLFTRLCFWFLKPLVESFDASNCTIEPFSQHNICKFVWNQVTPRLHCQNLTLLHTSIVFRRNGKGRCSSITAAGVGGPHSIDFREKKKTIWGHCLLNGFRILLLFQPLILLPLIVLWLSFLGGREGLIMT